MTDNSWCDGKLTCFAFEENYGENFQNVFLVKKSGFSKHDFQPKMVWEKKNREFSPLGRVKKWSKKCPLRRDQEKLIIFPGPLFNKESESDLKSHLKRFSEENAIYERKKPKNQ